MFNLAIDSKLRGCDLVRFRGSDLMHGYHAVSRAMVIQHKYSPVRFELTEQTRDPIEAWIDRAALSPDDYLFPGRGPSSMHLSTRQYARFVKRWVRLIGRDPEYGTHSLRRTNATLVYRRTKNLRAVQLLLGHTKLESTVRYLGALEISEQTENRGARQQRPFRALSANGGLRRSKRQANVRRISYLLLLTQQVRVVALSERH